MTFRIRSFLWLPLLAICVSISHGQQPDPQPRPLPVTDVMKLKLANAQEILEGVTLNDFDKIKKNADSLIRNTAQDKWLILRTPEYDLYTREFRLEAERLAKAADQKNTDAAALAYVELTLTCVKCHQYIRQETLGSLPPKATPGTPRIID